MLYFDSYGGFERIRLFFCPRGRGFVPCSKLASKHARVLPGISPPVHRGGVCGCASMAASGAGSSRLIVKERVDVYLRCRAAPPSNVLRRVICSLLCPLCSHRDRKTLGTVLNIRVVSLERKAKAAP